MVTRWRYVLLLVALLALTGCSLFKDVAESVGLLDAHLFCRGVEYLEVTSHPTDAENGLPVEVAAVEPHEVDWGDGTPIEHSSGFVGHTYTSAGTYRIECWTTGGNARREASFTINAENERPQIEDVLLVEDSLEWRQDVTVLLNPHVAGCNGASGIYTHASGIYDPDCDETRKRIRAEIVQEYLVEDTVVRYKVIKKCSVYSIHDRQYISDQWADIWGFWFRVGHNGLLPPYPFSTWTYASLDQDCESEPIFFSSSIGTMDWPGPDWPDPGCPDCDPDDPDPEDPEPDPEEVAGDCYVRISVEVVDRWGGYYGLIWLYDLPSCTDQTCCSTTEPPGCSQCGGG